MPYCGNVSLSTKMKSLCHFVKILLSFFFHSITMSWNESIFNGIQWIPEKISKFFKEITATFSHQNSTVIFQRLLKASNCSMIRYHLIQKNIDPYNKFGIERVYLNVRGLVHLLHFVLLNVHAQIVGEQHGLLFVLYSWIQLEIKQNWKLSTLLHFEAFFLAAWLKNHWIEKTFVLQKKHFPVLALFFIFYTIGKTVQ